MLFQYGTAVCLCNGRDETVRSAAAGAFGKLSKLAIELSFF